MPIVDDHLKANFGEAHVAARLAAECLVRPVAAGTDVGVDLYCETVAEEEREPHLHFWVQVKTGSGRIQVNASESTASYDFETKHLKYWKRQPVPVYAALVPVDWPVDELSPTVYVVSITEHLLRESIGDKTWKRLRSTSSWRPNERTDVVQFLRESIPSVTAQMKVRHGMIGEGATFSPEYVRYVPRVPVHRFAAGIERQMRVTAANAIIMMKWDHDLNSNGSSRRRLACALQAGFGDEQNHEVPFAIGISAHADGNFAGACRWYNEAIRIVEADPDIDRTAEPWPRILAEHRRCLSRAQRNEAIEKEWL